MTNGTHVKKNKEKQSKQLSLAQQGYQNANNYFVIKMPVMIHVYNSEAGMIKHDKRPVAGSNKAIQIINTTRTVALKCRLLQM